MIISLTNATSLNAITFLCCSVFSTTPHPLKSKPLASKYELLIESKSLQRILLLIEMSFEISFILKIKVYILVFWFFNYENTFRIVLMVIMYSNQYVQNRERTLFANEYNNTRENKLYNTNLIVLLKKCPTITLSSRMCWSFVFVVQVRNIVLSVNIICRLLTAKFFTIKP